VDYLLGVDVGSLSTKVVLSDLEGNIRASLSQEHSVHHPQPGWSEHDPICDWWGDFKSLIRRIFVEAGVHNSEIKAIGIVGAFPSPCIVSADGTPLLNAILYSDNRAEHIINEINQAWGLELTGDDVTPRLVWIKRNHPELLAQTRMILNAHSFIAYKLTGAYSIDFATASWFGGLYDYAGKGWDVERCAQVGIREEILPQIVPADALIGVVTSAAAEETGLAENTPVIAGSGDMYLALLGTGAVNQGDAIIYYGTAGLFLLGVRPFMQVIGRPFLESRGEIALLIAYIQASGEVVRWLNRLVKGNVNAPFDPTSVSEYASLDELASQISAGSDGVLVMPHFLGERSPGYRPQARGCIFGLTPEHTVAFIHRAVLESFGYGIRHALMGYPLERASVRQVFACGGGARSPLWRQIISDILGMRQSYTPKGSSALGAAYLAGQGIGTFSGWDVLQKEWLRDKIETIPDNKTRQVYDKYFENYLVLYESLTSMVENYSFDVRLSG
jgi:xylulokinase